MASHLPTASTCTDHVQITCTMTQLPSKWPINAPTSHAHTQQPIRQLHDLIIQSQHAKSMCIPTQLPPCYRPNLRSNLKETSGKLRQCSKVPEITTKGAK